MEESKELQGFYKIFRTAVYVSVLLEFFEYAIDPAMLDHWGGILCDIHGRIQQGRHGAAHLHYLYRHTEQEAFGVRCPAAGVVPARERGVPARAIRLVVQSSDGNAALYAAAEYHLLHGSLARGSGSRTYRAGQYLEIPQGGADEGPLQFREREF